MVNGNRISDTNGENNRSASSGERNVPQSYRVITNDIPRGASRASRGKVCGRRVEWGQLLHSIHKQKYAHPLHEKNSACGGLEGGSAPSLSVAHHRPLGCLVGCVDNGVLLCVGYEC